MLSCSRVEIGELGESAHVRGRSEIVVGSDLRELSADREPVV